VKKLVRVGEWFVVLTVMPVVVGVYFTLLIGSAVGVGLYGFLGKVAKGVFYENNETK